VMALTLTTMAHCDAVGRGIHAINKAFKVLAGTVVRQRQNLKAAICKFPYPPGSNNLMYTFAIKDS
ncbi:hypothetical protein, partial [Yoonia sp.]|uniref:hypothetical protein n=1 Tax=Yoonia sp. TaxID=2212373 RepID=UPI004047C783